VSQLKLYFQIPDGCSADGQGDFIEVYDGLDASGTLFARLCGTVEEFYR